MRIFKRTSIALFLLSLLAADIARATPLRTQTSPLIVLDPGHGGSNNGAFGQPSGLYEKQLTLVLAQLVKKKLLATMPKSRVRLTRQRDRYLTLSQRVELANRWRATLFVSIHLNASESHTQSGFETYILGPAAADKEAMRLAAFENRTQRASPKHTHQANKPSGVSTILADLRQRALHLKSLTFAKHVQAALAAAFPKRSNRGVRHGPFDVLMGLKMPGILVEGGFIDHIEEGKTLARKSTQHRLAAALARGIIDALRPTANAAAKRPRRIARRRR
jgi:N-acetylmuramoyl-L-alanine amidase